MRNSEKRKRQYIIIGLCMIILLMSGAYAYFSTSLKINGTAEITSNWCVGFDSSIQNPYSVSTGVVGATAPTASVAYSGNKCEGIYDTGVNLSALLNQPGDKIEYTLTIVNKSSFKAKIDSISIDNDEVNENTTKIKGNVVFKVYMPLKTTLASNENTTMKVDVSFQNYEDISKYNENEKQNLNVKLNFSQGSSNEEEEGITIEDASHTLTYNYKENGGTNENETVDLEYYDDIDLSKVGTKEGYTFLGWNTDKDAHEGLKKYKMPQSDTTLYAIYKKDIEVTYEIDGAGITSISKNSDSVTLYNNDVYNINLPTINMKNDNYKLHGWYTEDVFIGNSGEKYTFNESATVKAVSEALPVIKSWSEYYDTDAKAWKASTPDFHNDLVRTTITAIEFVDNINVPSGATSWDISAENNGTVMAWLDGTKLYIGSNSKVIFNEDSSYLFDHFTNVTTIDFNDNIDTSRVTNMSLMFNNCQTVEELDLSNFDTSNVTDMLAMFQYCRAVTTIDLSSFDTSKVTDMAGMFNYCQTVEELDLSNFDTSNVTAMSTMFQLCRAATTIDVSSFDTSKVTNMGFMFNGCNKVTTIDVSGFDTSNVTNMTRMFQNCFVVTTIDVSGFDTGNVENMQSMFSNCRKVTSLDVSGFDTSNVITMYVMFNGCSALTELNLTSFDTSKVTNMEHMFSGCKALTTIYALDTFKVTGVTSSGNMFNGATLLVGGNGTAVSVKKVYDKTYAKIDKEGQEGYFTDGSILKEAIITTSTTSKSITANVSFAEEVNVTKYEFKIGSGQWIDNGVNNVYRFDNLTKNTKYSIGVRYVKDGELITPSPIRVKTDEIETPVFTSKFTSMSNGEVTITYPSGCGSLLTCSYTKDNETSVDVTSEEVKVNYTSDGELIAYATDGLNEVSNSFTIVMPTSSFNNNGVIIPIVSYGDGLYDNGDGKYVYKGKNPDNYINIDGDKYRIIAIEKDGTFKVIRDTVMNSAPYDRGGSNGRYSENPEDYCNSPGDVCNIWGSSSTMLDSNLNNVTTMSRDLGDTNTYNLPSDEAYLNVYLNGGTYKGETIEGWYNGLSNNTKSIITSYLYDVGMVNSINTSLLQSIEQVSKYKWRGKIALMDITDYLMSNSNRDLCEAANNIRQSNLSTANMCKKTNWLYKVTGSEVILSPYNHDDKAHRQIALIDGAANDTTPLSSSNINFRPVFHISSNITITGNGTDDSNIYQIS